MAELYEIIDELCRQRGISGAKMAADLGMSRSTLTELRKGRSRSFTLETAQKVAQYLGVTVDVLSGTEFPRAQAGGEDEGQPRFATFQRALDESGLRIDEFDADDMEDVAAFMKLLQKRKGKGDAPF